MPDNCWVSSSSSSSGASGSSATTFLRVSDKSVKRLEALLLGGGGAGSAAGSGQAVSLAPPGKCKGTVVCSPSGGVGRGGEARPLDRHGADVLHRQTGHQGLPDERAGAEQPPTADRAEAFQVLPRARLIVSASQWVQCRETGDWQWMDTSSGNQPTSGRTFVLTPEEFCEVYGDESAGLPLAKKKKTSSKSVKRRKLEKREENTKELKQHDEAPSKQQQPNKPCALLCVCAWVSLGVAHFRPFPNSPTGPRSLLTQQIPGLLCDPSRSFLPQHPTWIGSCTVASQP